MSALHLKSLSENLAVAVGFAGVTTGVGGVDVVPVGLVPGGAALVAAPVFSDSGIVLTLSGGSDGEQYDVTVRASMAGGVVAEQMRRIAVIDSAWMMPDGSAGWLSIIEFVGKFGFDEMVTATQSGQSRGRIDRDLIVGALRDAQAEAEMSLTKYYSLPLSAVPGVIKTIVADIARVRLYTGGLPEGVSEAAKAARTNLRRISLGELTLPGVAGAAVAASETTAGDVVMFGGDNSAYPDGLGGYVNGSAYDRY